MRSNNELLPGRYGAFCENKILPVNFSKIRELRKSRNLTFEVFFLNYWFPASIHYFNVLIFWKNWKTGFVKNLKNEKSQRKFEKSRVIRTPFLPDVRNGCCRSDKKQKLKWRKQNHKTLKQINLLLRKYIVEYLYLWKALQVLLAETRLTVYRRPRV